LSQLCPRAKASVSSFPLSARVTMLSLVCEAQQAQALQVMAALSVLPPLTSTS
jgi:hypothetical protein